MIFASSAWTKRLVGQLSYSVLLNIHVFNLIAYPYVAKSAANSLSHIAADSTHPYNAILDLTIHDPFFLIVTSTLHAKKPR